MCGVRNEMEIKWQVAKSVGSQRGASFASELIRETLALEVDNDE